jgi:hypothetical protein
LFALSLHRPGLATRKKAHDGEGLFVLASLLFPPIPFSLSVSRLLVLTTKLISAMRTAELVEDLAYAAPLRAGVDA